MAFVENIPTRTTISSSDRILFDYVAGEGTNQTPAGISAANFLASPQPIGATTANTGKFTTLTATTALQAPSSAGLLIEAANGTDIGLLGVGNTANNIWYGGQQFNGDISLIKGSPNFVSSDTGGGADAKFSRYSPLTAGLQIDYLNDAYSLANTIWSAARSGYTCTGQTWGVASGTYTFGTGTITSLPTYNNTTASAANVFITSGGILQRSTSSEKYKKDIEPVAVETAYNIVMNLEPIWYRSICENDKKEWSWYGLSAEQVANVDPRFVNWSYPSKEIEVEEKKEIEEGGEIKEISTFYKKVEVDTSQPMQAEGVAYERLTVMLIKMVQEQQKQIDELKNLIKA